MFVIVILVLLDQLTKGWAFQVQPDMDVIGKFLRIQTIQNTGTIFGMFPHANGFFAFLSCLLCMAIIVYMQKKVPPKSWKKKAFYFILAGGIGNVIDRIVRGFVVDFVALQWVGVFNCADAYVVIGVILVCYLEWIHKEEVRHHCKNPINWLVK